MKYFYAVIIEGGMIGVEQMVRGNILHGTVLIDI
jgi:hypothetical protein